MLKIPKIEHLTEDLQSAEEALLEKSEIIIDELREIKEILKTIANK